jgi:hypothetical protein
MHNHNNNRHSSAPPVNGSSVVTDTLATALRALLGAYCGDDGKTPEDCQAAERLAREALAQLEKASQ